MRLHEIFPVRKIGKSDRHKVEETARQNRPGEGCAGLTVLRKSAQKYLKVKRFEHG